MATPMSEKLIAACKDLINASRRVRRKFAADSTFHEWEDVDESCDNLETLVMQASLQPALTPNKFKIGTIVEYRLDGKDGSPKMGSVGMVIYCVGDIVAVRLSENQMIISGPACNWEPVPSANWKWEPVPSANWKPVFEPGNVIMTEQEIIEKIANVEGELNWNEISFRTLAAWVAIHPQNSIGGKTECEDVESVKDMVESWWKHHNIPQE
jgi:hypothetical protein